MTWIPVGPSSVRYGLPSDAVPVAGRVKDVALSADGMRVYAAAATGGVWRSDDGGAHWVPTMDTFDGHPTTTHSCTLSCGAVAIDPTNPDRVFAGSGEPNWFGGVGVLRSDDAGGLWHAETADPASPSLMGQECYALLIDPNLLHRAVGVFSQGIYRREPDGAGGFHWVRYPDGGGYFYSDGVVVNAAGTTTFYVARGAFAPDATFTPAVLSSTDGATWTPVGGGFPASGVGSFVLGVQPTNANLIYALVPDETAASGALYRLNLPDPQWRVVSGLPAGLFHGQPPRCIAVDPVDGNRLFVATVLNYRCTVSSSGSGPTLTATSVNDQTHVDYQRLRYVGADSNRLWAASDGGVFSTDSATSTVTWQSRSIGLATIQPNAMDVHPTQDAVMFIATQDNGTIRSFGDEVWFGLTNMDGASVIVNWADPYKILTGIGANIVWRATDGAAAFASWDTTTSLPAGSVDTFAPLPATTPYDPASPSDADLVVMPSRALWLTRDFGTTWHSIPNGDVSDELTEDTFMRVAFANANRIFAISYNGQARRYDFDGTAWHFTNLVPPSAVAGSGALALDYNDPARASFYLALYGGSSFQRVWHYDGTTWALRSGPAAGDPASIPNAIYNTIVTDPANPLHVYAGCDIGVWRSTDGGTTWAPLNDGLPQAPVNSLVIHPTFRTLYAAVYGRGVYEYDLSGAPAPAAQLYIRDTLWDTGKRPTVDGLTDPTDRTRRLYHWEGPDIRVDAPAADGSYQFPSGALTPYDFIVSLVDESGATETAAPGAPTVVNRVYVRVHNRGTSAVNDAVLTLLLASASPALPDLPAGYGATVRAGSPLGASPWRVVGRQTLPVVAVGSPVVAEFDLPSTMLPPPAMLPGAQHYCLLAMVHSAALDVFDATEQHVDALTIANRKATNKNLTVVPMALAGALTTELHLASVWFPVWLTGSSRPIGKLVLDAARLKGFVDVVVPKELLPHVPKSRHTVYSPSATTSWTEAASRAYAALSSSHGRERYHPHDTKLTREHLERVLHGTATALRMPATSATTLFHAMELEHGEQHAFYMRFALPLHTGEGTHTVHLFHEGKPSGGLTYELRVPPPPRNLELKTRPDVRTGR